jgi:hypothetical protein
MRGNNKMAKLKGIFGAGLIFYVLVVLIVNFWGGFRVSYDVQGEENLQQEKTIFEKLETLNLIQGINNLKSGIEKLTSIGSADFDILGGLATSAVGVLQTVGGVITFPIQIFGIITGFYPGLIPEIIPTLLGMIVVIAISVLLISAKLGFDFT